MNKMELDDWTAIFEKTAALKESLNRYGGGEIREDDPGCEPGTVPEAERFVGPEIEGQEKGREPLVSQRARPCPLCRKPTPPKITNQHERANHAEKISRK